LLFGRVTEAEWGLKLDVRLGEGSALRSGPAHGRELGDPVLHEGPHEREVASAGFEDYRRRVFAAAVEVESLAAANVDALAETRSRSVVDMLCGERRYLGRARHRAGDENV
jgi:hypothetical protein